METGEGMSNNFDSDMEVNFCGSIPDTGMTNQSKWENVDRFDTPDRYGIGQEDDGRFVSHSDYAALLGSHQELVAALEDMVIVADFARWGEATTGRQITLKHALTALANAKGE